eukprot:5685518-Amphidinium_carterae.1
MVRQPWCPKWGVELHYGLSLGACNTRTDCDLCLCMAPLSWHSGFGHCKGVFAFADKTAQSIDSMSSSL